MHPGGDLVTKRVGSQCKLFSATSVRNLMSVRGLPHLKEPDMAADRKPIGNCEYCGGPAYKRRKPRGRRSGDVLLCYKHYMRLYRNGDAKLRDRAMQPEQVERARTMFAEGFTYDQIAERFGVSRTTVWRRLKDDYQREDG